MVLLKKEETLFPLDEEGKLKPLKEKVVLPINGEYPEIEFLPLLRKEWMKMLKDGKVEENKGEKSEINDDSDKKLVLEKLVSPKYDEKEIDFVSTKVLTAIVSTIMEYSGITDGNLIKIRDKILERKENESRRERKSSSTKTRVSP
ncbi:hypothetical protein DRN69_06700 [Candidatus Pacearchaeota archaeon]|nr:MAG: hypothetical protein DRN69_06700 [Candidatus Pacearchaeota archaeon]